MLYSSTTALTHQLNYLIPIIIKIFKMFSEASSFSQIEDLKDDPQFNLYSMAIDEDLIDPDL